MNRKLSAILMIVIFTLFMIWHTIFTLLVYSAELFGLYSLLPEFIRQVDWHFYVLVVGTLPVYFSSLLVIWVSFQTYRNPRSSLKFQFRQLFNKIGEIIQNKLND